MNSKTSNPGISPVRAVTLGIVAFALIGTLGVGLLGGGGAEEEPAIVEPPAVPSPESGPDVPAAGYPAEAAADAAGDDDTSDESADEPSADGEEPAEGEHAPEAGEDDAASTATGEHPPANDAAGSDQRAE